MESPISACLLLTDVRVLLDERADVEGEPVAVVLECNSIDIWNLRLDLGFKLRQVLMMRLGMLW